MTGYQDQPFALPTLAYYGFGARRQPGAPIQLIRHPQQGIDPGIAGHHDPLVPDPLPQEIIARPSSRREVEIGYVTDQPAVHLLGPGCVDVVRTQTGLDVRHWKPVVKGSQRRGKSRSRVSLHDDAIGPE